MPIPREPAPGRPLSPQWGRDLQRHVASLKSGSGLRPRIPPARRSSGGSQAWHPFQITKTADGGVGDPGTVQVQAGHIRNGNTAATGEVTIVDLATDLDVEADSIIFLVWDAGLDTYTVMAESLAALAEWTDYPTHIRDDAGTPPAQTHFFILIGYVGAEPADPTRTRGFAITIDADPYWIYQCLDTNLALEDVCSDGMPALYPFPSQLPGPPP